MSLTKNTNLAQTISKLYYAFDTDIESISSGSSNMYKAVSFLSNKQWKEIYFTPKTANYKESKKDTDAGTIYNHELNAFYPGEDETDLEGYGNLNNRPIIVKIVYSSGQTKLIGNKNFPAFLSDILNINNKTGRAIVIRCKTIKPAYWFEEI